MCADRDDLINMECFTPRPDIFIFVIASIFTLRSVLVSTDASFPGLGVGYVEERAGQSFARARMTNGSGFVKVCFFFNSFDGCKFEI